MTNTKKQSWICEVAVDSASCKPAMSHAFVKVLPHLEHINGVTATQSTWNPLVILEYLSVDPEGQQPNTEHGCQVKLRSEKQHD